MTVAAAAATTAGQTAELCAQALSRCPPSQIGRLLAPWSRFEATRYLTGSASSTPTPIGGTRGSGGGADVADTHDGAGPHSRLDWEGAGGAGGEGSPAPVNGDTSGNSLAQALVAEGVDMSASALIAQLVKPFDGGEGSHLSSVQSAAEAQLVGGPGRAAEGALRLLLLREHGLLGPKPPVVGGEGAVVSAASPSGGVPAEGAAAVAAAAGGPAMLGVGEAEARMKAVDHLCIALALAELRSESTRQGRPTPGGGGGRDGTAEGIDAETGAGQIEETERGPAVVALRLADGAAEEFGVGAVERGVGYALAAADGRGVLRALRALLEETEGRLRALREDAEKGARDGGGEGGAGRETTVEDEVCDFVFRSSDNALVARYWKVGCRNTF